ncbi:MAG: hypothetical protein COA43_14795 [Robiginitomaculum sp.]|nr:MAG: hypothetical protein COA43_14795 [Robiginitomaculum sp.]
MQIKRVYMNKATQQIKAKGYTLTEFLEVTGISLRSYRRYEKQDNKYHSFLGQLITDLKVKL